MLEEEEEDVFLADSNGAVEAMIRCMPYLHATYFRLINVLRDTQFNDSPNFLVWQVGDVIHALQCKYLGYFVIPARNLNPSR